MEFRRIPRDVVSGKARRHPEERPCSCFAREVCLRHVSEDRQEGAEIQFQWQHLAHCLHRIFWGRVYDGAIGIGLPTDALFNNVERFAASPRVRYALKYGRRLSDEQYLEFEFAKLSRERDRLRIEVQQEIDDKIKSAEIERLFASIRARHRLEGTKNSRKFFAAHMSRSGTSLGCERIRPFPGTRSISTAALASHLTRGKGPRDRECARH